jgi:hypothetical protein
MHIRNEQDGQQRRWQKQQRMVGVALGMGIVALAYLSAIRPLVSCNPILRKLTRGSQVQDPSHPGLHSETLTQKGEG